jgi:hypothetical protein
MLVVGSGGHWDDWTAEWTELHSAGWWDLPKECHLETSLAVSMAEKTAGGWVQQRAAKTVVW